LNKLQISQIVDKKANKQKKSTCRSSEISCIWRHA